MLKKLSLILFTAFMLFLIPICVRADDFIAINSTNFPDTNFRNHISEKCDLNGDGYLSSYEIYEGE